MAVLSHLCRILPLISFLDVRLKSGVAHCFIDSMLPLKTIITATTSRSRRKADHSIASTVPTIAQKKCGYIFRRLNYVLHKEPIKTSRSSYSQPVMKLPFVGMLLYFRVATTVCGSDDRVGHFIPYRNIRPRHKT